MCLQNKFLIPKVEETILPKPEAEQLFERSQVSFAVVKAMPGFGKTAVFARAAKKWSGVVGWYSLDVTDNDSACFLSGLEQLWEGLERGKNMNKTACSEDRVMAAGTDRENGERAGRHTVAARMLSLVQKVQSLEKPIHIVWDNLQVISSEEIFQLFLFFMYYTKEKISFIFLTNKNIPTVFLPLLSREGGRLLSEDSLRLTSKEVWQSMEKKYNFSRKIIDVLTEDLCGWPLGIQWILKYLREKNEQPVLCKEKTKKSGQSMLYSYEKEHSRQEWNSVASAWEQILRGSRLWEYLNSILWENCPEKLQSFFKQTAVFDTFTWEMCETVFPVEFSRQNFEDVVAHYGFVKPVPGEVETYRYGRAFRAFFFCQISQKERGSIYRQAAHWYEKKQNFIFMTECAISGKQEDILVMAIEQYGRELLCEKNRQILGRMIEYLEKNAVLLLPETSGIVAQYFYSQGDFNRMEKYLDAADRAYGKENKYRCYRNLYWGLIRLEEDFENYEKQIHRSLFFLRESGMRLPYLMKKEESKLRKLTEKEEETKREVLRVDMFDSCRVTMLADGRELTWRTKKGRELFAYLLDTGGSGVGRRQLIELLWQEEIPGNAVAMLHNMIYNIRKELSACHLESLIAYENRKYRLHTEKIETDLRHIKTLAKQVEQKDMAGLKKEYRSFLKYWGSYLEDLDSFWVEERRTYYDEIFKKGCRMLADDFVKEKEYETALKLYENILFLDAYSEETVEKMILLYGKQKSWKKLKQCYKNLENVLKKDLGIQPGENVLAAYHKYF